MKVLVIPICIALLLQSLPPPAIPAGFQFSVPPELPNPRPLEDFKSSSSLSLRNVHRLEYDGLRGPESLAFNSKGEMFTGVHDGHILRVDTKEERTYEVAFTGGAPLGMQFDHNDNLIVCDAMKGLLQVDVNTGAVSILAAKVSNTSPISPGAPLRFVDDLDIASDGTIYFSDASDQWVELDTHGVSDSMLASWKVFLAGHHTGKLCKYSPKTGEVHVLADNIWFANGVALSEDESFLLIADTMVARVYKYMLVGPKAGTKEVFLDELPGGPDNIRRAPDGSFWIALVKKYDASLKFLAGNLVLRKLLAWVPGFMPPSPNRAMVLHVDQEGQIIELLADMDPEGIKYHTITQALEHDGTLYLTSLKNDAIGTLKL